MTSFIGITLFVLSLMDFLHTLKFLLIKIVLYGFFGVFITIPAIHSFIKYNFYPPIDTYNINKFIPFYFAMFVVCFLGLILCAKKYL
jgi:hypothetical protein